MPNIQDVSATLANTSFNSSFNFATGRILSLGELQAAPRVRSVAPLRC